LTDIYLSLPVEHALNSLGSKIRAIEPTLIATDSRESQMKSIQFQTKQARILKLLIAGVCMTLSIGSLQAQDEPELSESEESALLQTRSMPPREGECVLVENAGTDPSGASTSQYGTLIRYQREGREAYIKLHPLANECVDEYRQRGTEPKLLPGRGFVRHDIVVTDLGRLSRKVKLLYPSGCNRNSLLGIGERVGPCDIEYRDVRTMPYRVVQTFENGMVAVADFRTGHIKIMQGTELQTFD